MRSRVRSFSSAAVALPPSLLLRPSVSVFPSAGKPDSSAAQTYRRRRIGRSGRSRSCCFTSLSAAAADEVNLPSINFLYISVCTGWLQKKWPLFQNCRPSVASQHHLPMHSQSANHESVCSILCTSRHFFCSTPVLPCINLSPTYLKGPSKV